jgi:hypothetical protein
MRLISNIFEIIIFIGNFLAILAASRPAADADRKGIAALSPVAAAAS